MDKLLAFSLFLFFVISSPVAAQDCENTTGCGTATDPFDPLDTTTVPANSMKTCDVATNDRNDCGGNDEAECVVTYNCCWDANADPGVVKCFIKGLVTVEPTTQQPITDEATTKDTVTDVATTPTVPNPAAKHTTVTSSAESAETTLNPTETPSTEAKSKAPPSPALPSPTGSSQPDPVNVSVTTESNELDQVTTTIPALAAATEKDDAYALTIASVLVDPYLKEKANLTDDVQGNDRYEGFIKDYLDALATRMKFKYTLLLNEDYGKRVAGQWTGVIGDVLNQKAHFAAAPLIVTVERETVVDFTWSIFNFEAVFVMQQRHPKQTPKIESFDDLVKQMRGNETKKVGFGITRGGSLAREMENSKDKRIAEAWGMMQESYYLTKDTTNEGFLRARLDSQYAFLTDELTAEYVLREEPCELEMVKAGFFKRRLAFAVRNQDPLNDKLNKEILYLDESGEKQKMYDKWWGENKCVSGASVIEASIMLLMLVFHFLLA